MADEGQTEQEVAEVTARVEALKNVSTENKAALIAASREIIEREDTPQERSQEIEESRDMDQSRGELEQDDEYQ